LANQQRLNPIRSLPRNDVNNRDISDQIGVLWCWDVDYHVDSDLQTTTLIVLDSNKHALHVENYGSLELSRGDVVAFYAHERHALTRSNNRRALFSALYIDTGCYGYSHTLDRAKELLKMAL
jgi:hypothetical protein